MCGIAGILSFDSKVELPELKRMTDQIKHRGPDGEGQWVSEDGQVGFGHRRLSILDLSENGKQPMHYQHLTITFNGEIYNYVELRKQLLEEGYVFQSDTDTEVLLALYLKKGKSCLSDLDGMFSFAIWDHKNKTLFCARDRFGEKPFFYSQQNGVFAFASEMKSIFGTRQIQKIPSERKLMYYLGYNVLELASEFDTTFFEGINKLEPAHYIFVDSKGDFKKERYWEIDSSKNTDLTFDDAREKFSDLFIQSIKRRLRSDVAVGSSLSGGLDSSSIVRVIDKELMNSGFQNTFSARFKDYEKDEGDYMEMAVQGTSINTHYTWVDADYMSDNFESIFYHQEEPFGSSSIVAQHSVMRLAKKNNVTVLLDGQGADEYLAGYIKRYYKTYLRELYAQNKVDEFNTEKKAFEGLLGRPFNFDTKTKLQLKFGNAFEWLRKRRHSKDNFGHLNQNFVSGVDVDVFPFKTYSDLKAHLKFSTEYQLPDLLRYADRNSMAFSREIRLPFLNHELVELVFSLPHSYKINNGWSKYLLRKSMDNFLPKGIAWRKEKVAFQPPQQKWTSTKKISELIGDSKELLVNKKYLDPNAGSSYDWQCICAAQLFS